MSRKAAIWSAFCVKRLADGGRILLCTLKTDDEKACVYSYTQKKGDTCTSTLIKHVKNNNPKYYEIMYAADGHIQQIEKLSTQLGKKIENDGKNRYITSAMALDSKAIPII